MTAWIFLTLMLVCYLSFVIAVFGAFVDRGNRYTMPLMVAAIVAGALAMGLIR